MTDEMEPFEPFKGVAADAVAGAVLGYISGGAVGAALAALQPWFSRLVGLSQQELRSNQERVGAMWVCTIEATGASPREVLEATGRDPYRSHLASSAEDAAGQSLYPARIVLLAEALAKGLLTEDDAVLDHQQGVIDASRVIQRPHLAIMERFLVTDGDAHLNKPNSHTFDWDRMRELAGPYRPSLTPLLATLQREGLVSMEQAAIYDTPADRAWEDRHAGQYWRLTDFGLELLAWFRDVNLRLQASVNQ